MTSITGSESATAPIPSFAGGVVRCERCGKTVPVFFLFRRCDRCLEWETDHLAKGSEKQTSWMAMRW